MLAGAHAANDEATVRWGLERLAGLGYAPSVATIDLLAPRVPPAGMERLRLRFDANRASVQASRLFATVPAERRLVEGIAWDAGNRRLFAATVVGRALLVREATGWRSLAGVEGGSLFGLAVDTPRRLLWIASGVVEQTPEPSGAFRGLIALDLDRLTVVRRIALADGSPADIAVAPDGTVFASDPASGAIYRLAPGADTISMLVPPGRLRNPQGLVPTSDGRLYVSDYVHGLALVTDGGVSRVESLAGTMLDGIDGLAGWNGDLIAIQNGTSPRRILRLHLSRNGGSIERVTVLESAHPEWGEPTLGYVEGNQFIYVADAQWERYGAAGAPTGEGAGRATAIRAVSLTD